MENGNFLALVQYYVLLKYFVANSSYFMLNKLLSSEYYMVRSHTTLTYFQVYPKAACWDLVYFYSTWMICLKDSTKKQQSGYLLMIQLCTWQSPTIRMQKSYKISPNLANEIPSWQVPGTHKNKEQGTNTLWLCASWPQARTRTDCKILGCHYLTQHALEHTRGQHSEERKQGFGLSVKKHPDQMTWRLQPSSHMKCVKTVPL